MRLSPKSYLCPIIFSLLLVSTDLKSSLLAHRNGAVKIFLQESSEEMNIVLHLSCHRDQGHSWYLTSRTPTPPLLISGAVVFILVFTACVTFH